MARAREVLVKSWAIGTTSGLGSRWRKERGGQEREVAGQVGCAQVSDARGRP